jgi:hypothetical protein
MGHDHGCVRRCRVCAPGPTGRRALVLSGYYFNEQEPFHIDVLTDILQIHRYHGVAGMTLPVRRGGHHVPAWRVCHQGYPYQKFDTRFAPKKPNEKEKI